MSTVLLIGTGRAAFHLGHALVKSGVAVVGVVGRDGSKAGELASTLGATGYLLGDALPSAEVVLLAVTDDAIATVAAQLLPSEAVVTHTSGARQLEDLAAHAHRGVLWPIQSLSPGEPVDLGAVPLVVDGNNAHARSVLRDLAMRISNNVIELSHAQRQRVHLAAVLASNFPVFLMREGQRLLRAHDLPPDLLMPLWTATTARVAAIGPDDALTGPARRGDVRTVRQHLDQLADDPDLRHAYAALSELIMRAYGH